MLLCRHEFVVEKVTKDGSEMVGKSARRDVVLLFKTAREDAIPIHFRVGVEWSRALP